MLTAEERRRTWQRQGAVAVLKITEQEGEGWKRPDQQRQGVLE